MDRSTRNAIERATQQARRLLDNDYSSQLEGTYDVQRGGIIAANGGPHLSAAQRFQRNKIVAAIEHKCATGMTAIEAVADYVRDAAFTTLNRFTALKMLEARQLVQECITRGDQSAGYKEYCGMAPGVSLLPDNVGYRLYIESLFDELATEIRVQFNRRDAASVLWPRRPTIENLLAIFNAAELAGIWGQDETIGWIYQYYNEPNERKMMREDSAAPRNSRELAIRNQFFTPRYVVEFLTDNTLGRIWHEMTRGKSAIKERCRYLAYSSSERFQKHDDELPSVPSDIGVPEECAVEDISFIPPRTLKDPRTILMLDPACGSMHFGLYAFDLFEIIYEEAWMLEEQFGVDALHRTSDMKSFHDSYPDRSVFLRDVPRLIIEHNLHGIDIDPRCVQIAALSLWLRAQKSWQRLELSSSERPIIKRSNIVCAEPMPGEKELLQEFVEREFPSGERGMLLRLLEVIFEKMRLAGEAGILIKIEDEIRSAIDMARREWQKLQNRPSELFDLAASNIVNKQTEQDLTTEILSLKSEFFDRLEGQIYSALHDYAEQAEDGTGFQRRLFANDAAQGFAFIDICRKKYDVWLMNPPFGAVTTRYQDVYAGNYPLSKADMACAFVERGSSLMAPGGRVGVLMTRTPFFLSSFAKWRTERIINSGGLQLFADLGFGVLDAMVETCAYVLQPDTVLKK